MSEILVQFDEWYVEEVFAKCVDCRRMLPLSNYLGGRDDGTWEYDTRCLDCFRIWSKEYEAEKRLTRRIMRRFRSK